MIRCGVITVFLLNLVVIGCQSGKKSFILRDRLFDDDWKFSLSNPIGAENPNFDDSRWRSLDLPHDWSIEDISEEITDSIIGPFSKASVGKMSSGYTVGGIGWYRKSFILDKSYKNKIVYLKFDGVYMNSDVWINGNHLGHHPNGYTPFYHDVSSFLNPIGQKNTIAVRVKNEGKNERWYSGSGIYRHVWLTKVNPTHIKPWGIFITTPVISDDGTEVKVAVNLLNSSLVEKTVTVGVKLLDARGKKVGESKRDSYIKPNESLESIQKVIIKNPELWSINNPKLYSAEVTLLIDNKIVDKAATFFGVRKIKIDSKNGFSLNGENILLNGGCIHHDNGPLGAAAIDRAEERKIEVLKREGYNAIRLSHNPPSPKLLEVCDKLGMMVIYEAFDIWEKQKHSKDDHHVFFKERWQKDIQSMILRDRNHPSIIMWSIGNEIPEMTDTSGYRIAKQLINEVRSLDSTRNITAAWVDWSSLTGQRANWDIINKTLGVLDVVGYNYGYKKYEQDHVDFPDRVMYSSESMTPLTHENWRLVEKHPYVIGNFSWTAMDYIGEAGIGLSRLKEKGTFNNDGNITLDVIMSALNPNSWPIFNSYCGEIDLIGNKKPSSYYRDVVIGRSKIEMFVQKPLPNDKEEVIMPWGFPDILKNWTWPKNEGEKLKVFVFSKGPVVKLELNGKVVGEQRIDIEKTIIAMFDINYEPGILKAINYDIQGKELASAILQTVGKPTAINLLADREKIDANRNDLSYIQVEIVDENGNLVRHIENIEVEFEIMGKGEIVAVGNGNPIDMSSFKLHRKKCWQGRSLVIVRPLGEEGEILLKARVNGLPISELKINVKD